MNHQPFRDWIVAEEPLTTDQSFALQDHLQGCASCQQIALSWKELEQVLNKSPQVTPPEGFTLRLASRLQQVHARQKAYRNWALTGVIALIVGLFFLLLITQTLLILQSPGSYISTWLSYLLKLMSYLYMLEGMARSISFSTPLSMAIGMFFLAGMTSFLCVFWLATYRRLSMPVREA